MGKKNGCFWLCGLFSRVRYALFVIFAIFLSAYAAFAVDPPVADGDESRLNSLTWIGYYDPGKNYVSAKAMLRFESPMKERRLWLADGLQLNSVRSGAVPVKGLSRDFGQFRLHGQSAEELEISYSGRVEPVGDSGSIASDQMVTFSEVQLRSLPLSFLHQ